MTSRFYQRALVLYEKGFGFRPIDEDRLLICNLMNTDFSMSEIIEIAPSAKIEDWLGTEYLVINKEDYSAIDRLLNKLLGLGVTFRTANALGQVNFTAERYSRELAELNYINTFSSWVGGSLDYAIDDRCTKLWSWKSSEGRDFCNRLRSSRKKKLANEKSQHNYLCWPLFQNCDMETLEDSLGN